MREILIVDDVELNIVLLQQILSGEGYRIRIAQNGVEALNSLREHPSDLVLLDINMPQMNGIEACMHIKRDPDLNAIPVIFLSAYNDTEHISQAFEVGGCDYITKPFRGKEVLCRIANQIAVLDARRQSERFSALNGLIAMTSGIAHELNTPLGISVTACSEVLDSSKRIQEKLNNQTLTKATMNELVNHLLEAANLISSNLDRSGMLVERFQSFLEDQTQLSQDQFELADVVNEVRYMLHKSLQQQHVTVELEGNVALVAARRCYQVLFEELIKNSLSHAYPHGGPQTIHIRASQQDDTLTVHYRDNGCGMEPQNLRRLFQPFYTTKRNQGYIGLSAARIFNLVCLGLNGKLKVDSRSGEGLCYEIEIPGVSG